MMADLEKLNGSRVPNPVRPRAFANPDDIYDDVVGFDNPMAIFQPGVMRYMWRTRPAGYNMTRVTTTQSQASTSVPVPIQTYKQGVVFNPSTTSTTLLLVPDMSVSVITNGATQVGFQITASTVNANDPGNFAIFRDNIQISQIFQQHGAAGINWTISQTLVDNPAPGPHVYALYWAKTTSTLTGLNKARSIYVINLKPV